MAQFMIRNKGKRAVCIDGWWIGYAGGGSSSIMVERFGMMNTKPYERLPIVLSEQDTADFLVVIDNAPLDEITAFGVSYTEDKVWFVSDQQVKSFIATAKQHA